MRRALACAGFLLLALSAAAAERWWDAYNRGVAAVNSQNYAAAATALQKAIAENGTESTGVRAGDTIITYVPHFWLGIAKFNLGDTDGALREWKISEDQGAVARTAYYSKLKDWVARAETEKQRDAQKAASGAKKAAETAISRAVEMQGNALSAGGDRTESYRDAQRRLQQALAKFRTAGTDSAAYNSATQIAEAATQRFTAAAEEGKKLRAAAGLPKNEPKQIEVVIPVDDEPEPVTPKTTTAVTQTTPVTVTNPPEPPMPVTSKAKAGAEVAVQSFRNAVVEAQRGVKKGDLDLESLLRREAREGNALRDQLAGARTDADFERIRAAAEQRNAQLAPSILALARTPPTTPARVDLGAAYRAYASGDYVSAEEMLTRTLNATPAAEAFLLRGCVRYTRGLLSRNPDPLLLAATDDFKAALERNRALRLDPGVFSPKLIARFEQVRSRGK